MRKLILKYVLLILMFSNTIVLFCKNNHEKDVKKQETENTITRDSIVYNLVKLLLPLNSTPKNYKTYIEFFSKEGSIFINGKKERLNIEIEKDSIFTFEEKKSIQKLINNFVDTTAFEIEKMGSDYITYYNNEDVTNTKTLSFNISNIIFNDSMNTACFLLGTYYSNESPGSKISGFDELVFFNKENGEWIIKSSKSLTAF